jgi:F1F0 ATPase subunit 2
MSEPLSLVLALITGVVLGAIFFGGLWWTVRKCVSAKQPALWFLGGGLLRMTVVLAGFYLVAHGHWERLLVCLLGFVMARVLVTRITHFGKASLLAKGGPPCTLLPMR